MAPLRKKSRQRTNVFVSYRRSDSGPYAQLLYDALSERFGRPAVFWDLDSIAIGRDFVDAVNEWLDRSDILIVVIGPSWLDTADDTGQRRLDDPGDHVRLEIETALKNQRVTVVPVLVGGATMPDGRRLPDSLAALSRKNATSLVNEHWQATMGELLDKLEHIAADAAQADAAAKAEAAERTAALAEPRTNRRNARAPWVAGAIALALVVAVVVLVGLLRSGSHPAAANSTTTSTVKLVGTWQAPTLIAPPDSDGVGQELTTSCTSSSFCVAAVVYSGSVLRYNGATWTKPKLVEADQYTIINGVSCTSSTFCMAVDGSSNALSFNGTSWTRPVSVDTDVGAGGMNAVSCTSPTFCMAVDDGGVALAYNGSTWHPRSVDFGTKLDEVSCANPAFCVALDKDGAALLFENGLWSTPRDVLGTTKFNANALSCPTANFCVAVGSTSTGAAAVAFDGTNWIKLQNVGDPNSREFESVSCVSSKYCMVGDGVGRVVAFDGTNWTASRPIAGPDDALASISCPDTDFCMAVTGSGKAIRFDQNPS